MARLSIRLLGPIRVAHDGKPVTGFATDKARALLAYLVTEADQPHRREYLAGLLWPDYPEASARNSLRTALANLRSVIGDRDAEPPFLHISRQAVQFNADSDAWCDVIALRQLVIPLSIRSHQGENVRKLEQGVELYQSSFLEGFSLAHSAAFEDWALITREQLHRGVLGALHHLATYYEERAEYDKALQFAWRQLELEPWHEGAQRQLMRLLALSDQRGAALAQYERYRRLLAEELAVEPARETAHLFQQIRDGELQAPQPPVAQLLPPALPLSFLDENEPTPFEAPVFVARERELAQLDMHLERALAGNGRVVFVAGDAGRGKTALLDAFGRRAQQAHSKLLIAEGTCNTQYGVGDSYLPFRQTLEMLTGDVESRWVGGRVTSDHARRLWAILPHTAHLLTTEGPDLIDTVVAGSTLVARAAAAAPPEAEWLTRLVRLVEVRAAVQSAGNLEQTDLFEQYARVLSGVARQAPLVLLVDDLQWADAGSIGLLFHLGRRLADHRILLLCAYRPEELFQDALSARLADGRALASVVDELRRVYGDIVIDLDIQDADASRRFVEAFLDSEPNRLGAAFRQTLHERTGGHPLFTVELVRMLQERGDLVQDGDGRWTETHAVTWDELPARVEAVIARRLGRLAPGLHEALVVASVEGEEFTAQVVAQVLDLPERQWFRSLGQELEKGHRLVQERSELRSGRQRISRYRFVHNLFQRYLYEELGTGECQLLHAEVARALEGLYAAEIKAVTVQLAFHYSQARLEDKAIYYLTQAGHQARARYASQEALRHYSEALSFLPEDHPNRFDLLAARSVIYGLLARRGAQRGDIDTMLALAEALDDKGHRCDALIALSDYFLETEPFLAREPLEHAAEIAHGLLDLVREAHVLRRLAWAGRLGADYRTSRMYVEQAVARFEEAGLPGEAARCLLTLARRVPGSGQHTSELEAAQKALALSRQADDPRLEAIALRHLAIAHMNRGQHGTAVMLAKEALAMHRDLGDRSEECYALDVLGVISAWLGKPGEAETHLRRCLNLAQKIGSDWGVLGAAFGLWTYWYLPRGEYEQLLAFCDERLAEAQASGHEWLVGFFGWIVATTLSDLGRFDEALELQLRGLEPALTHGDLVSQTLSYSDIGRSRAELGDADQARQHLTKALDLAEKIGDPCLVGWVLTDQAYLALLAGEQSEWRGGSEAAERAVTLFRTESNVGPLATALDKSARLHLALGELDEALESSTQAMRLLETAPALPKPQDYLHTHARVLRALGRETEAGEYLRRAYERVILVAEKLTDEALRQSWLENVRVNREILRAWGGAEAG